MIIKAKNALLKKGPFALDFKSNKDIFTIDYYDKDEFLYQLECDIKRANQIYKQSIYEGFYEQC